MKLPALVLAGMLVLAQAQAQVEISRKPTGEIIPAFDVDAISFASTTSAMSRLDVYAAIAYEQLSFVKQSDLFTASYEMTIALYDSANALVVERLWTENVTTPSFEQSVSPSSFSIIRRSIDLPPGLYKISVLYRDLESKVTRRVAKQLTVSDFTQPGLHLSDIMLIGRLAQSGDKRSITPSISPNVGNIGGSMHLFFEAYNDSILDSAQFVITILSEKNAEMLKADSLVPLTPGRNQVFLRVDQSSLPIGDYRLYVQAFPTSSRDSSLASTSRSITVRWGGLPKTIQDIDVAIDQLVYIAKDKELSYIKEATTPEEKQTRFIEFWKKRDPNPNTTRNEKMEEHYARVEYANKYFKHYTDGWRTDMGMVYIIFGTPSNVDRHPFDAGSKPYEVWSYYELNHSFVFVDQTGFGDYRLTTPIWEVQRRLRN
ncbi:MAG: GWxTD domain-containing protein [Bacteroidetes bacterium]|nr:GWxTD domain-containing protein [Bacteroidota bacterium]MCW5893974.1 GWxTD domain-containing protein [Bacteroidota bacterium]